MKSLNLKTISILAGITLAFCGVIFADSKNALALNDDLIDKYTQSDIWIFDPDEDSCREKSTSGGKISIHAEDLPTEAVQQLEAAGVKEKAEQQYDKYKAAADKYNLKWQVIATLHYREGGMNPEQSCSDGEKLPIDEAHEHHNVDGVWLYSDPQKDADQCAEIFDGHSKTYGVDFSSDQSLEAYGKTFLAYNRGYLYKNANIEWDLSPYPMNYIDDDHIAMKFPYPCRSGNAGEPLCGQTNLSIGALAVMIYLGAFDDSDNNGSFSTAITSASSSSDGSDVTYIGDSISNRSLSKLKEKMPEADYYIQDGKIFSERDENGSGGAGGLTILREIVNKNKLRKTLIFALGANEQNTTQDSVDKVLDLAKTADKIVFITQYKKDVADSYDKFNKMIRDTEASNDKVIVVDWKAEASKDSDKYIDTSDSTYVHPTPDGTELFANLVYAALGKNAENTTVYDSCDCTESASASGLAGGLTDEQIKKLEERYASHEDLNAGRWTYSANTDVNCVSLSTWFVQLFSDVGGQSPLTGGSKKGCIGCDDGQNVAWQLESNYGLSAGNTPKPLSIFSVTPQHTGVVLRVNDDGTVATLESGYGYKLVWIDSHPTSYFVNTAHSNAFTYLDGHIDFEALGKVLGTKITSQSASQNGAGGVAYSDVKWKDGWIDSGMDGFEKYEITTTADSAWTMDYTTKLPGTEKLGPNKITLHTTEGTYSGEKYTYTSSMYPPHFTIDMVNKKVWQHYSIYGPSNAVKDYDTSAGVQIEIVGYSGSSYKDNKYYMQNSETYGDDEWAYLAKLLSAISSETKIPLTTNVDWENPERLSSSEWMKYEGVLAHMHVPSNDHTDTGNIWPMLSKQLGEVQVTTEECDWGDWEDEWVWYSQCDNRWAHLDYSQGDLCTSGCGPTSLAMIASSVNRKEITPDLIQAKTHGWRDGDVAASIIDAIKDPYELEYEPLKSITVDAVNAKLREGYVGWTAGKGAEPFTDGGHYIAIRGLTEDGKWLVGDSKGNGEENTFDKEWDPAVILSHCNGFVFMVKSSNPNVDPYPTVVSRDGGGKKVRNSDYGLKELSSSAWPRKYLLYVPEKVDAKSPLIVWIHGVGEWGSNLSKLKAAYGFPYAIDNMKKSYNAYILMPQMGGHEDATKIKGLVDEIISEKKYHIDKNRVHIMGFSAGAMDVTTTLAQNPNFYASATYVTLLTIPQNQSTKDALSKVPVRIYWSDGDLGNTPAASRNYLKANAKSYEEIHYGSSVGHGMTSLNSVTDDSNLVQWMLKQRRK